MAAEVFLFVLIGATVNINYLGNVGIKAFVVIVGALVLRMMAYTPKATVQAAIGGIPFGLGFGCGDAVLTVAVLAIVLTAPLGAFAIDLGYQRLLER